MPESVRKKRAFPFKDLSGQRFGRLLVISRANVPKAGVQFLCACDCGRQTVVWSASLTGGTTRSCGCLARETTSKVKRTHGMSHVPEYGIWMKMVLRCEPERAQREPHYAGRGITVTDRWTGADGFLNFLADMGPRPSPRHSLDRIDNDGHYEPGNCRWATRAEQARNKRNSVTIQFRGETLCLGDWADRIGICSASLSRRIRQWGLERALTQPPQIHASVDRKKLAVTQPGDSGKRYVEAPKRYLPGVADPPAVFLAGGITGCPDWQQEARRLLEASPCVVLNPRRPDFPIGEPSAAWFQIDWEFRHLRKAKAVLFWFPKETLCPIALYELGAWSMTRKPIFVGAHPEYQRRQDVVIQTDMARPGVKVVDSVGALVEQFKAWLPEWLGW